MIFLIVHTFESFNPFKMVFRLEKSRQPENKKVDTF